MEGDSRPMVVPTPLFQRVVCPCSIQVAEKELTGGWFGVVWWWSLAVHMYLTSLRHALSPLLSSLLSLSTFPLFSSLLSMLSMLSCLSHVMFFFCMRHVRTVLCDMR